MRAAWAVFCNAGDCCSDDAENAYLAGEATDEEPIGPLFAPSITYRIAVGPQAGRKGFTLQTLPAYE